MTSVSNVKTAVYIHVNGDMQRVTYRIQQVVYRQHSFTVAKSRLWNGILLYTYVILNVLSWSFADCWRHICFAEDRGAYRLLALERLIKLQLYYTLYYSDEIKNTFALLRGKFIQDNIQYTKFYHNRPSLIQDMTRELYGVLFGTRYTRTFGLEHEQQNFL